MLISSLAILVGLFILTVSADKLVEHAITLARLWRISPLLVGIVIVGFGTSAPELVVAVFAALDARPELALGNAYGSNIANIALIIGVALLIAPISATNQAIQRDMPIMAGATLLSVLLIINGQISRWDALMLLLALVVILAINIYFGRKQRQNSRYETKVAADPSSDKPHNLFVTLLWLLLALLALIISARILVWGAVNIAEFLGLSELVIGLTIIAIGTSLPELAAAIAAMRQKEPDLVLGNIIGSNIFNALAVVGLAGVISPMTVSAVFLWRDVPYMLALTGLLLWWLVWRNRPLTRWHGLGLLLSFAAYLVVLGLTA